MDSPTAANVKNGFSSQNLIQLLTKNCQPDICLTYT